MHRIVSPLLLIASCLLAQACCFTPDPGPPPTTVTDPGFPPSPPAVAPPAPPTTSMEMCLALCEHAGQCLDSRGAPRSPETADCTQACAVGHTYGSLPAQAYVCLNQPTCRIFESCVTAAMGAALAGGAGPPALPPGVPSTGVPSATGAPANWPDGFPVVAGGIPVEAPPAGPVRVALLMYSMSGEELDGRYHAELASAGWTATATEAGPEARRFSATREATTVSVSILSFDGGSTIQTMQF